MYQAGISYVFLKKLFNKRKNLAALKKTVKEISASPVFIKCKSTLKILIFSANSKERYELFWASLSKVFIINLNTFVIIS